MTDDSAGAGTDPDGSAPGAPAGPSPDPWQPVLPAPPAPTADGTGAVVAGPAPLAAGTAAGWYRTTAGSTLRYWDGTVWTERTAPGEEPRATYRQRFRRRYWIVLLVMVVVNLLGGLLRLAQPSLFPAETGTEDYVIGTGVGIVIGAFVGALVWTSLVAIVPGRQRLDPDTGEQPPSRLRPWSILAAFVTAPVLTYLLFHVTPVSVAPLASASDACHAFMQTTETLVRENASLATTEAAFSALHDAAQPVDPSLATDVAPLISDPSTEATSTATQSILTRCIQDGDLTTTEVRDWSERIKALLPAAGS